MMELAREFGQGPLSLKEVSSRQQIPLKYLEQIAMVLKEAGIIDSVRGPAGGYKLNKAPDEVNLLEVVEALEGSIRLVKCVRNPEACDRADFCAFSDLWEKVSDETAKAMRSVTLADMLKNDQEKKSNYLPCIEDEVEKDPSMEDPIPSSS